MHREVIFTPVGVELNLEPAGSRLIEDMAD